MSEIFHIADYALFAIIILISLGIGIFYSRCGGPQKTTGDYLMGGRNMGVFPVSVSLVVSYVSTITFLGISAEIYYFGIHMAFFFVAHIIGALLSAALFVPLMYPLKITSVNEYLMMRFNSRMATLMGTGFQILNWLTICGIISIGFAYLFQTIAEFPVWATLVIMLTSSSIYTCIGGFKAVVWTDVFQSGIMVAGLLAVVIKGLIDVGGPARVSEIYMEWGRHKLEWFPSPHHRVDMWSATLIVGIKRMVIYGIFQGSVQRYNSLPTFRKAISSLFLAIPCDVAFNLLSVGCGLVAFAYYTELGCDPLKSERITNPNQIIPVLVTDILNYPGVIGLFVASVLAGVLSTISTGLSALSAMTWHDLLEPMLPEVNNRRQLLITKGLVLFYGVMGLIFSFILQQFKGTLIQMTIAIPSAFITGMAVLFVLGASFPRLNYKGAALITLLCFGFVMWMTIGAFMLGKDYKPLPTETKNCNTAAETDVWMTSPFAENNTYHMIENNHTHHKSMMQTDVHTESSPFEVLYKVSSFWYCTIGLTMAMILGLIFSQFKVFQEEKPINPRYIFPVLRRFLKKDADYSPYDVTATKELDQADMKLNGYAPHEIDYVDMKLNIYAPAKESKLEETALNGHADIPNAV